MTKNILNRKEELKSGCLVCGQQLVYTEEQSTKACFYCKKKFQADASCVEGHYVCDRCHSMPAHELIEPYRNKTKKTDPIEIANDLMKSPQVKMHGTEHHYLVPAVLLTAYYNGRQLPAEKKQKLHTARNRSTCVLGGFCGSHGTCGAAMGTGIFISLITNATPLSETPWMLSNMITSKSLLAVAKAGGPRCCKRDTYLTIAEAVTFLNEEMNVKIPLTEKIICGFSRNNRECLFYECSYYAE